MNSYQGIPPGRLQLWRGALLATIAHTIGIAANPLFSYELSWDGMNYSRQDSQGTRGTVTFASDAVIGVFRDDNSTRIPIPGQSHKPYDLSWFFRGIPEDLMLLAHDEALQFVLDEHEGKIIPIVTAAFWGQSDTLNSAETWADVFEHGAHLISIELAEPESAIAQWIEYYDFAKGQDDLLRTLYTRRIAGAGDEIIVSKDEYVLLTSKGIDGIEESRALLSAINVKLPK